jgi:RHS repeat-associated protein
LRFSYTGREQDGETGLDYYRARYYDSANGKFISEDPIGFSAGDGNLSRYVGNSPVNGTDPSGNTSPELYNLLTFRSHPSSNNKNESIYYYDKKFNNYREALITATNEFLKIIDLSNPVRNGKLSGTIKRFNPQPLPYIPWGVTAPLKGPTGIANLRPGGLSGPNPTIDLKKDRITGKSHETPFRPVSELKFLWKGDKKARKEKWCPDMTIPDVFRDLPVPQPRPITPSPPSPPSIPFPFPLPLPRNIPSFPPFPFPELPQV